jgi:hypothetical protein
MVFIAAVLISLMTDGDIAVILSNSYARDTHTHICTRTQTFITHRVLVLDERI